MSSSKRVSNFSHFSHSYTYVIFSKYGQCVAIFALTLHCLLAPPIYILPPYSILGRNTKHLLGVAVVQLIMGTFNPLYML